jgi:hypothetical protein
MKMPRRFFLPIVCLLVVAGQANAQRAELDWIDRASVNAGNVEMRTTKADKGTVSIDLAIAIDADWKTVWDLLTACEISPEYVPHVISCSQIDTIQDGAAELFLQTVKPAFFLPKFEHVFRLDYYPPERIEVSHVSGPIDRMEGSWTLIDRPGEAMLLVHSLTLKPGFPVPPLFVRNTLKRDLPTVLREIRKRAESPGSE